MKFRSVIVGVVAATICVGYPYSPAAAKSAPNVAAENIALGVDSCSQATVMTGYSTDGVSPMRATLSWGGKNVSYTGVGVTASRDARGGGPGWKHTFKGLDLKGARNVTVSFYSREYPGYPYLLSRGTYKVTPCESKPVATSLIGQPGKPTPGAKPVNEPIISGNPMVGETLTVGGATFSPAASKVIYTWIVVSKDGLYNKVATGDSYTVAEADAGLELLVSAQGFVRGRVPGTSFSRSFVQVP